MMGMGTGILYGSLALPAHFRSGHGLASATTCRLARGCIIVVSLDLLRSVLVGWSVRLVFGAETVIASVCGYAFGLDIPAAWIISKGIQLRCPFGS